MSSQLRVFGCASVVSIATLSALHATSADAQFVTDATRLGAFSGAMRYCEERHGGDERRYRYARLRAAGAIDGMGSRDKLRAIGARDRAYEAGQFLGNRLDARECKSLLKLSEWKAFID